MYNLINFVYTCLIASLLDFLYLFIYYYVNPFKNVNMIFYIQNNTFFTDNIKYYIIFFSNKKIITNYFPFEDFKRIFKFK